MGHGVLFKRAKRGNAGWISAALSFVCASTIAPPALLTVPAVPLAARFILCRRGPDALKLHEQRQPDHNPGARRAGYPHAPPRPATINLQTEDRR